MTGKVFVLGSINADYVMTTDRIPKAGESVMGKQFQVNQGGKGANQAVACAKLGCPCELIGAVGSDAVSQVLLSSVSSYGVETRAVRRLKGASGACMIVLDEREKENYLLVAPGANDKVDAKFVCSYLRANAKRGDIFITQLEVNRNAVSAACRTAKEAGMYVILNPAPAAPIGEEILSFVDLVVPNETEAEFLTGKAVATEEDARSAYLVFAKYGVGKMIVTLGARGCVYADAEGVRFFPAVKTAAVDPTSAGDTFIGAIAARLCRGESAGKAIPYAALCSAVTVSRRGAAESVPTEAEIEKILDGKEACDVRSLTL